MDEKLFCFLDVLGFSSLVNGDEYEVGDIFNRLYLISYVAMIDQKIRESRNIPSNISNPALKMELSGFENYQWGSDSMFAYGDCKDCDLFISQIAHFIYASFQQHIEYFSNLNFSNLKKKVPLLLLRGGIALGEVNSVQMSAIFNKTPSHTVNVFGKAVLKAISYEKKIKGPRVFFDDAVHSKLCNSDTKEFVVHPYDIPNDEIYELLWPMIAFQKDNLIKHKATNELDALDKLLGTAAYHFETYKSKSDHEKSHIDELVCLILRSAKQFYRVCDRLDLLYGYVEDLKTPNCVPNMGNICPVCKVNWDIEFRQYVINMFKRFCLH